MKAISWRRSTLSSFCLTTITNIEVNVRLYADEIVVMRSIVSDAIAQFDLGIKFLKLKHYAAAYYWLMRSAKNGYQKASVELDNHKELFKLLEIE